MIIVRAPLRISFVGGGTDVPAFYEQERGCVFSTTINKYVYVFLNQPTDNVFRVKYKSIEEHETVEAISHPIVRETLLEYGWNVNQHGYLDIATMSDVSGGTGLGSSSAFTIAMCRGLHELISGTEPKRSALADLAFYIERDRLQGSLGRQDHAATAFGGLNTIVFPYGSGFAYPQRLTLSNNDMKFFWSHLAMYYLGSNRTADVILKEQEDNLRTSTAVFSAAKELALLPAKFVEALVAKRYHMCGSYLNDAWNLKKTLSSQISNDLIDILYQNGLSAGAFGGKLLGAGATGYLLFIRPPEVAAKLDNALSTLTPVNFEFERRGVTILTQMPTTPGAMLADVWTPDSTYD